MLDKNKQEEIEKIIGYEFKDKEFLEEAFTQDSKTNMKLAVLGDAIVDFLICEYFYEKVNSKGNLDDKRKEKSSNKKLYEIIKNLKLDEFLILERGGDFKEFKKPISTLYEAIVGAIYRDSKNLEKVKGFLVKTNFFV